MSKELDTLVDARIKVLTSKKYQFKLDGKEGTIVNVSCGTKTIGVKIDGCENPKSSIGLYWFDIKDLEIIRISTEENVMLNNEENFVVAGVKFLQGTNTDHEYYYALFDEYELGDTVVVQTGHHGLAIAEITSIDISNKNKVQCSREIVSRVDMTEFYKRREKRKLLAKLKEDMDKKVKELQEFAIYELLAEKDEALGEMLSKYKELTNGTRN